MCTEISFTSSLVTQLGCEKMGSILLDGDLISIGQLFTCPMCSEIKKTIDFLTRVQSGKFKSNDIICNACFDKRTKTNDKRFKRCLLN